MVSCTTIKHVPILSLWVAFSMIVPENDFPYPKDEPGEEMSELARVWRLYIDEATKFDTSLIEGCNRGIDVLLVFVSFPTRRTSLRPHILYRLVSFLPY